MERKIWLSADSPPSQGKGVHALYQEFNLGPHARIEITEAICQPGTTMLFARSFKNVQRMASLHFCLNGSARLTQGTRVSGANILSESCQLLLVLPHETIQEMTCRASFQLISMYFDLEELEKLLGPEFDCLPPIFVRSAGLGDKCSSSNFRWSNHLYRIASEILYDKNKGPDPRLYFESKMLESISLMLAGFRQGELDKKAIRVQDIDKVRTAREILLANLVNPPSIHQLAKLVGTNEFTLKKGFRTVFGIPVYQLLQQIRMKTAWDIFQSDKTMGVGKVASLVGYEDHSAFTRVFSQIYGIRPIELRKS